MEGNPLKGREGKTSRKRERSDMNFKPEVAELDEEMTDISIEDLREFLEADHLDVRADPGFKERLRRKLWDLVQSKYGGT